MRLGVWIVTHCCVARTSSTQEPGTLRPIQPGVPTIVGILWAPCSKLRLEPRL